MPEGASADPHGVGYIDGGYCAKQDMRLPVADPGFLLSDRADDAVHVHDDPAPATAAAY